MNLNFLYTAISWLLLRWHQLWALAFGEKSDLSWVLSIIFLVITIRLVLFPLFVKQIHSQRKMQELQPKLKALQTKHKGDKETLQREMMALYKENGANPVAGCLPIFLQAPVFLSLYHVLKRLDPTKHRDNAAKTLYGWTANEFDSAAHAKVFGAPISAHLSSSAQTLQQLGASVAAVRVVGVILIAIMVVTTYITQRQILAKQSASGATVDPQQQMIQRLMLYGIPASLLVSGSLFPLGVVLYWCTTNVWSMGQQFYVLRRMPPPGGTPAVAEALRSEAEAQALVPKPGAKPQISKKSTPTAKAALPGTAATTEDAPAPARSNTSDTSDTSAGPRKSTASNQSVVSSTSAVPEPVGPIKSNGARKTTGPAGKSAESGSPANGSESSDGGTAADTTKANGAAKSPAKAAGRTPTNRPKTRKGGRR
ncbi:MAG: membrane protein insertase YidC [Pseudonocardiales bacterium]|nr:MAG: membrane protein insertase YidC [Pseudonocardiales bacterium]